MCSHKLLFWWCYCLCAILLFPTTRWECLASLCCPLVDKVPGPLEGNREADADGGGAFLWMLSRRDGWYRVCAGMVPPSCVSEGPTDIPKRGTSGDHTAQVHTKCNTTLLLYRAVSGIFAGSHWNIGLYSSQPVTWSLPFVNIIWDVQTSLISPALCKACWVHCFSGVVFTDGGCCNLTTNSHVCRSDSVHALSEAAFQCLHFHSSNVVSFEQMIAKQCIRVL